MTDTAVPQPHSEPGHAVAEEGVVILEGPGAVAITMTADAAGRTGQSLLDAAAEAQSQQEADSA